jgi:protein-S-isoprenylcysteine O-methyltransferase Ste14
MIYIFLGAFSFIIMLLYDIAGIHRKKAIKPLLLISAALLFCFAFAFVTRDSDRWSLPPVAKITGWVASAVFFLLLFCSLTIELNFSKTYLNESSAKQLVTTGTYALTRHPGVLWFVLLCVSVFFATGTKKLLIAALVWSIADMLYATIQDLYIFPRVFGKEYEEYKKTVPMFIPTVESIRNCKSTIFRLRK